MSRRGKLTSAFGQSDLSVLSKNALPAIPPGLLIAEDEIDWSSVHEIGKGANGSVYKAKYKSNEIAIKIFHLDNVELPQNQKMIINAALEVAKLDHVNVVKCLGLCLSKGALALQLASKELILGPRDGRHKKHKIHSLRQMVSVIGDVADIPPNLMEEALCQIATGLAYLHSQKIIHGDLKSGNVLVTGVREDEFRFMLTDFGEPQLMLTLTSAMTARQSQRQTSRLGTLAFEAPEVLENSGKKEYKSDIYAYAMIAYEMLHPKLRYPWAEEYNNMRPELLSMRIVEAVVKGTRPKILTKQKEYSTVITIMEQCWNQKPANRPTAAHLVEMLTVEEPEADDGKSDSLPPAATSVPPAEPLKQVPDCAKQTTTLPAAPKSTVSRTDVSHHEIFSFRNDQEPMFNNDDETMSNASLNGDVVIEATRQDLEPTNRGSSLNLSSSVESGEQIAEGLIMKWQGYSSDRMNIKKLKEFQLLALNAYESGKDVIVMQATSSGKSVCFQLPAVMLPPSKLGLLIVPTLALGINLAQDFEKMQVPAIFLHGKSTPSDRAKALDDNNGTKVIIALPETIFGNGDNFQGILNQINPARLNFVAIDEGHLVYEWARFRAAYDEVRKLKTSFNIPFIVTSATLKPSHLYDMKTKMLKEPVVIKGTVDRPNVTIKISSYSLTAVTAHKNSDHSSSAPVHNKMYSTAVQLKKIVGNERAMAFCAYVEESRFLCASLLTLNVKAASFTGQDTNEDKLAIFNAMQQGSIQILVGTKAVGLGINIPNLRYIFSIGLPENLETYLQFNGRAGRSEKCDEGKQTDHLNQQSFAYLLVNEKEDQKKLQMWTSAPNLDENQKEEIKDDVLNVWKYFSHSFTGGCLRQYQQQYFEDDSLQEPISSPDLCCSGCEIRSQGELKKNSTLLLLLQAVDCLENQNIEKIYESRLVTWMAGKTNPRDNWIQTHFNKVHLDNASTYGCLAGLTVRDREITVKVILRQCFALDLLSMEFSILAGKGYTVKHWKLTELGRQVAKLEAENPCLPDPLRLMPLLQWNEPSPVDKEAQPRGSRTSGNDLLSQVKKKMAENHTVTLERRSQYEFLGAHHDSTKLIHVPDISLLKSAPKDISKARDFLWNDINFTKDSTFPKKQFKLKGVSYDLKRARCNGVKVCDFKSEAEEPCSHAVCNRKNVNSCMKHPDSLLKATGPCDGYFVYVSPTDTNSNERFLGFLHQREDTSPAKHSHPIPAASKLGSMVEADMAEAIKNNPNLTAKDLMSGEGMEYNPNSVTLVASDIQALAHVANKHKVDSPGGGRSRDIIRNFDEVVKKPIDERDSAAAEKDEDSKELDELVLKLSTPYKRFYEFTESLDYVVLATPHGLNLLSEADVVEADVTYPGCSSWPYCLNGVTYNPDSNRFEVVFRVMLNKLTQHAYQTTFTKVFEITTNLHASFDHGKSVECWVVDFSVAQRNGLSNALQSSANIRGCGVHYRRNGRKAAVKVFGNDSESIEIFLKIAYKIPDLATESDVTLAFEILRGKRSFDDDESQSFLLQTVGLTQEQASLNNSGWIEFEDWVKWWEKPRTLQMFSKALTQMTQADWNRFRSDTNGVESQNKVSQVSTAKFITVVRAFYTTEKNNIYKSLAASQAIAVGPSLKKRKAINVQRKSTRMNKRARATEKSAEADEGDIEEEENPFIGKTILVYTKAKRSRKFNWLSATVELKNRDGSYLVKYSDGSTVLIPNILDKEMVTFPGSLDDKV